MTDTREMRTRERAPTPAVEPGRRPTHFGTVLSWFPHVALSLLSGAYIVAPAFASDGAWQPAGPPGRAQALTFSESDPNVLYAGTDAGVFRSDDYGSSWAPRRDGLTRDVSSMAVHPSNPDIAYASDRKGLNETDDGGRTWRRIRFQNGGYGVLRDPHRSDVLYTTRYDQVETNAGGSWRRIFPQDGTDLDSIEILQIDPLVPDRLYLVASQVGVFVSEDGGESWERRDDGLPAHHRFPYELALDPRQRDRAYLAISGQVYVTHDAGLRWEAFGAAFEPSERFSTVADLVVAPTGPPRVLALHEDALWTSDPETPGWTEEIDFTRLFPELGNVPFVHGLALDPKRPGSMFAMATTWLAHSPDGGATWRLANTGLPADVTAIETSPRKPGVVWAATTRGAVWRSDDAGRSWRVLGLVTDSPADVDALRVDPRDANEMVATWSWPNSLDSGIATSRDGGRSWSQVDEPPAIETDLFFHPEHPGEMYGRARNRIVRSLDGGLSWQDFSDGLPTDVGSLWHGVEDAFTLYAYNSDHTALYRNTVARPGWILTSERPPLVRDFLAVDPLTKTSYVADGAGARLREPWATEWQDFGDGIYQGFGGLLSPSIRIDPFAPGTLYYRTKSGQGLYRRSVPCTAIDTDKGRLAIRHLQTPDADDFLDFRGELIGPLPTPLDPTAAGFVVSVRGADGHTLLDAEFSSDVTWRAHRGGTSFRGTKRKGTGTERVRVTYHPSTGRTSLRLQVRKGDFASARDALPRWVDLSLGGGEVRYCARFAFADQACRTRHGDRQIVCR